MTANFVRPVGAVLQVTVVEDHQGCLRSLLGAHTLARLLGEEGQCSEQLLSPERKGKDSIH